MHDKRPVRRTEKSVRAGNHIEAVLGLQFAGMMNHQQAVSDMLMEEFQKIEKEEKKTAKKKKQK